MTALLTVAFALLLLAGVAIRLAALPLPDRCWRCRASHGAWVAAHVLIGTGAMWLAIGQLQGEIQPGAVVLLLAGMCLKLLGRWRRRGNERHHEEKSA